MDALGATACSAFPNFRYMYLLEMLDTQHAKKDEELAQTMKKHMRCDPLIADDE